ncbi:MULTISPECIES: carboxypeptidase-like regulatory domain-containing protein [Hymenobacter]|uniref:Carboxypeptidase regulatory-like domain-containing protein n=2 Tax=Hymenobacter TaxID=89966 RepID=A0A7Y7PS29_9BACT|nr:MULTISPECIES: carboxypeptidase-like regulatory domain-containing protein [Hymenobacter]NVO32991.1 carboxypeptidase regulatory-like domain-containing protein [Hymenobacter lapidiphilus]NVO84137.1 carboxypeptidase regulatory-like domain-containing protein [Hymenobacter terrestris]
MKATYLTLAALTLLVTGCARKDEIEDCLGSCTTVTGRLVTSDGQQALPNTTVEAEWHYGAPFPQGKTKARTTSDANGNYRLTFFVKDEELAEGFFVINYLANKQDFYVIGEPSQAIHKIKRDTTYRLSDYLIPRKAFVRLSITNPAAVSTNYFASSFNNSYGTSIAFNPQSLGGGSLISWAGLPLENPLPIAGDLPIIVRSFKDKNGITERTIDSLFIPAGTTANYTVTY